MFGSMQVATCGHGYPVTEMDECDDCLALEKAKRDVLASVDSLLFQMTDPDDTTTRALMSTVAGKYVSMKMHRAGDGAKVYRALAEIVRHQLPCAPGDRMTAQAMMLTEASFSAHEPDRGLGVLEGTGIAPFKPSRLFMLQYHAGRVFQFVRGLLCP